jgi:hypothetical protein
VEHFGWRAAPAVLVPIALLGLAAALILRFRLVTADASGAPAPAPVRSVRRR